MWGTAHHQPGSCGCGLHCCCCCWGASPTSCSASQTLLLSRFLPPPQPPQPSPPTLQHAALQMAAVAAAAAEPAGPAGPTLKQINKAIHTGKHEALAQLLAQGPRPEVRPIALPGCLRQAAQRVSSTAPSSATCKRSALSVYTFLGHPAIHRCATGLCRRQRHPPLSRLNTLALLLPRRRCPCGMTTTAWRRPFASRTTAPKSQTSTRRVACKTRCTPCSSPAAARTTG